MNPDVTKLQVLNDLIAQTLDAINMRNLMGAGLSHSPYATMGLARNPLDPRLQVPVQTGIPGFSHTGVGMDPRLALANISFAQSLPFPAYPMGLGHSPYEQAFQVAPRVGIDPRFGVANLIDWTRQGTGLMHTPWGLDPRFAVPTAVGINPFVPIW